MFITVEEMQELKAKYQASIAEMARKVEVIDEFIGLAMSKPVLDVEEPVEELVEEEVEVEETTELPNY